MTALARCRLTPALDSTLTPVLPDACCCHSQAGVSDRGRICSPGTDPAGRKGSGAAPLYGPDRVHAQVLAVWARMEGLKHRSTRSAAKKRKLLPCITQSDGRDQLPAAIHSFLDRDARGGPLPSVVTIKKLMSSAQRGTLGEATVAAIRLWVVEHRAMLPKSLHDDDWDTYHHTADSFNEAHCSIRHVRVVGSRPQSEDLDCPGYAIYSRRKVSNLENAIVESRR